MVCWFISATMGPFLHIHENNYKKLAVLPGVAQCEFLNSDIIFEISTFYSYQCYLKLK